MTITGGPAVFVLAWLAQFGEGAVYLGMSAAMVALTAGISGLSAWMWRRRAGAWPAWWIPLWGGTVLLAVVWVLTG